MTPSGDFLSRFINWFSASGADKAPVAMKPKDQDYFSRLMNRISG